MTNPDYKEIAEHIQDQFEREYWQGDPCKCKDLIAAEIERAVQKAVEDAVQRHRCDQVPICRTRNDNCIYWAEKEARAEERERCARIAELFYHECGCGKIGCNSAGLLAVVKNIREPEANIRQGEQK